MKVHQTDSPADFHDLVVVSVDRATKDVPAQVVSACHCGLVQRRPVVEMK